MAMVPDIALTVGGVVAALMAIFIISSLIDWYEFLAWKSKYGLKGSMPLPFLGHMHRIFTTTQDKSEQDSKRFGACRASKVGVINTIHVSDTALLKKIFVQEFVQFQNRYTIEGIEPWPMPHGLLSLRDEDWKRVRSIITPTFSASKLKMMMETINACSAVLTTGVVDKAAAGQAVDAKKHFGCYTMDVISGTAFGLQTDSYNNPDDPFVSMAKKVFGRNIVKDPFVLLVFFFPNFTKFLMRLFGFSLFWPRDSVTFFTDVVRGLVEERRSGQGVQQKKVGTDLLQLMMNAELDDTDCPMVGPGKGESKKKLDMDELLAQGFLSFLGGYDTTNNLLSYLSFLLASHPAVQRRLVAEIDEHYPPDEAGISVKYDSIGDLKYLEQVICEALRLYPPVCRMNRMTSEGRDVQVDDHWFPANTMVAYSIWQIHHDPDIYMEPDSFDPNRFLPEAKASRDPITFIPFGYGPRNCVGMRLALLEAKVAIVHLLRKVTFLTCPETPAFPMPLIQDTPMNRPKYPIIVGVELRQ